ncbi:mechanosensitive ion channel family protein, partial [Balneolaceae bacterium ANBcel3]|nr:mechanosensitive ion channel family protein [Balneolaceae bacterium ANBcel3]
MDFSSLTNAFLTEERLLQIVRLFITLLLGFPLLLFLKRYALKYVTKNYNAHYGMLVGKVIFYTGLSILLVMALNELGFSLAPLLGAAGILGIAIGFASQTSVSNVISGFFLIAEQSVKVGDIVSVGGNVGIVLSIDTLSVKLRLFDNRYLRVPNETMIKSEFINIARFPVRRVDCNISVAYKEDLNRVREVLFDVADKLPYCLQEPAPLLIFDKFGS